MDQLRERLHGVHSFLTTPFGPTPDYELDADGLRDNVRWLRRRGGHRLTVVVAAGLGEIFSLTAEEHAAVARAAVAGAGGHMPVVIGACGGFMQAMQMCGNAADVGVDAVLLFAPPYWGQMAGFEEGVCTFYSEIAAAFPRLGILIAMVSGSGLPAGKEEYWPRVLRRLAQLPNVLGFEDSSGLLDESFLGADPAGSKVSIVDAVSAGQWALPDNFLWVARGEGHAVSALPAGARAVTSAVSVFAPDAARAFWRYGTGSQVPLMKEVLRERLEPFSSIRGIQPWYGVAGLKAVMEACGNAGGWVRPPGLGLLAADRARVVALARRAEGQGARNTHVCPT